LERDIKINNKNIKKLENKIEILVHENKDLINDHDDIKKMHSEYDIVNKSNLRYKNEMFSIKEENKNLLIKIEELTKNSKNGNDNCNNIIFENDTKISELIISNKKLKEEIEEEIEKNEKKFEN